MSINCPEGQLYTVRQGDTLFRIAQQFNTTVADILAVNPQITNPDVLEIGQVICIPVPVTPCPGGTSYTIRAGDTLFLLAQRFGTTVTAIVAANPGIDPNNLQIGQVICIPEGPPEVPRPRCIVLNPTDLVPTSKGAVFVETDVPSVLGIVTNVPDPTVFTDDQGSLEVYKLFVTTPTGARKAVATMEELLPGYWVGRVEPGFSLTGANVLIAATREASMDPVVGVAVGIL